MKNFCDFLTFGDFFGGKTIPVVGSALLNHVSNFESAPAKDFLEGADGAGRLLENQVERPWGSASCDDDGFLSFQEGNRVPFFTVVHHAVNPAVEKHFELPGHVAPVARRTDYKSIAFLH